MELDEVLLALYPKKSFTETKHAGPLTEKLTAEIERHSAILGTEISNDFTTLKKLVERHELIIQDSWSKRRRARREKILLETWPTLPKIHNPDLDLRTSKNGKLTIGQLMIADETLWPYLNLEDLSKPLPILVLLKSRGRSAP